MEHKEQLHGVVDRVIYQNKENGFAVFVLQINSSQQATIKGYLPTITAGEQVSLTGSWNMHQKFGKQFDAKTCETQAPTSIVGLKKYLGSGLIKGIGPTYAEKLVNHFGQNILEIIDTNPERLMHVPGIGSKRIEKIMEAWKTQKSISTIMVFLQSKGISTIYAVKIYKFYKENAIAIIQENPYRLAQDIWGIGFKTADAIAQKSGIAADSSKRIAAAILHAIQEASNDGHLYVILDELKKHTAELIELDLNSIQNSMKIALHELYSADKIKLITHDAIHYITLPSFYFSEKNIAYCIKQILSSPSQHYFNITEIKQALIDQAVTNQIGLNEQQQAGVVSCLHNKISIVTGGPGTGKTTLIRQLLEILEKNQRSYFLAAPTGRAAKRITEGTGRHATTIHRLLAFDASSMRFTRNENNPLVTDFLIIDEASMIDIFIANAIIKALPPHAHLILIGDTDQLPSVGPGNFLQDLITSEKIRVTKLSHIFRQAENSMIVLNAHRINQGEFPTMNHENARKDFIFIKEDDPQNISLHLKSIFDQALPHYNINQANAMVLTPMHRGVAGTQKINHDLQQMLNENSQNDQPHITYAGTFFYVNDRVMQLRNNYDKNVFNGDIGTVEHINIEDKIVQVRFFETLVDYEVSDLNELTHAYAISIHKSQGSEFCAVIIPIFMQHFMMLQRNLLYTGITRAKKLCIFIGQSRAIAMAVKNNKSIQRLTFLHHFLTSDIQCR